MSREEYEPSISMTGFLDEPPALKQAMNAACSRVLASTTWILGSEVKGFEKEFAESLNVDHAVGVANGMDALEIILRARGIGPGHEIITTPMTAVATVLAILRVGATPVLADIEPETGLLSIDSAQSCLTHKTRGIILVHLYGQARAMADWQALCRAQKIDLIEDCAQSHGAMWQGTSTGSFGVAGAYSFYPTKNLGGVGDGGAIVSTDGDLAERSRILRNYGEEFRYQQKYLGLNSRLDELQAALLRERLRYLTAFTGRRQQTAWLYQQNISNPIIRLPAPPEERSAHVYHQFVINTPDRRALQSHLSSWGVPTLIHYPLPIHRQKPFHGIQAVSTGLQSSEIHAETCISLPCHPQLTHRQIEQVIHAIEAFTG